MITISQQPPLFNYSKNPIVVKANTNKYLLSEGSKAVTEINTALFTAPQLEVFNINIKTNLFTQNFTFQSALGNTATNIVIDETVIDNDTFATYVAKRINQNYYLNKYYVLSTLLRPGFYPIIYITSKNTGSDYSITTSVTFGESYDIPGVDAVPSNAQILLQVFQYDNATTTNPQATLIGARTVYPDVLGDIVEDVSDIIDDFLEYQIGALVLTSPFILSKAHNRYYITVSELNAESYLTPDGIVINPVGILNTTADFYAIKGGVDKLKFIKPGYSLTADLLSKNKNFLTAYPGNRTLFLDVQNNLFFVYTGTKVAKTVSIHIAFVDGRADNDYLENTTPFTVQKNILMQVFFEFSKAAFDFIESTEAKIKNLSIQILDTDNQPCSEKVYYDIDTKYYKNLNKLILKNSLGGYEDFYCKGALKKSADVDFEILNKTMPAVYNLNNVQQTRTNAQFSTAVIINTGHLKSREEKKWLVDLLIQGEGFHVIGDVQVPIVINTSKILISDTTEDTYSFDIEFTYSYTNTSYTA